MTEWVKSTELDGFWSKVSEPDHDGKIVICNAVQIFTGWRYEFEIVKICGRFRRRFSSGGGHRLSLESAMASAEMYAKEAMAPAEISESHQEEIDPPDMALPKNVGTFRRAFQ